MGFELRQATEVLGRTPETLRTLLGGLSEPWLTADEGRDTFTPRDVVGHLIHGEETDWVPRIRIILEHGGERPFESFDRRGFREAIADASTDELLDRFAALRKSNLEFLKSLRLTPFQLTREGTHPELGRVTLEQLIATWVVHDLGHIRQIVRVMAKRYREAVGPWKAYLPVLEE